MSIPCGLISVLSKLNVVQALGDFSCSKTVIEFEAEQFELKIRTRESLGINIAGLFTLYRNGHTLNFLISPPKSTSKNINIYSKAFFIILSGSSLGMF